MNTSHETSQFTLPICKAGPFGVKNIQNPYNLHHFLQGYDFDIQYLFFLSTVYIPPRSFIIICSRCDNTSPPNYSISINRHKIYHHYQALLRNTITLYHLDLSLPKERFQRFIHPKIFKIEFFTKAGAEERCGSQILGLGLKYSWEKPFLGIRPKKNPLFWRQIGSQKNFNLF